MSPKNYVYQLQTLRARELRQNRDYTDQAMTVYDKRLESIEASDRTPEQKEQDAQRAATQYHSYMQREIVTPE